MNTIASAIRDGGPSFVDRYLPPGGGYDELRDPAGAVRGRWRPFLDGIASLPAADLAARAVSIDRRVI